MKKRSFTFSWSADLHNGERRSGAVTILTRSTATSNALDLAKVRFWTSFAGAPTRLGLKGTELKGIMIEQIDEPHK